MADMQLSERGRGDIAVSGRLGFAEVTGLLKTSTAFFNGQDELVFDLSAVEKVDSAGLALLVEWMSMAKKSSQAISFKGVPQQMLDIARVGGLEQVLPLVKEQVNKVGIEIDG